MPVKISELAGPDDLTGDDKLPMLDGGVTRAVTTNALADYAAKRIAALASGPSVEDYADPSRPERVGTTFLDHDGILWLVNAVDGIEGSQTALLNLVQLALSGVDLLGAPQVVDAAELAADDVLSYGDGESTERVTEGLPVYGAGGFAWIVIEEAPSYAAHVTNANGVNFREVGYRFTSLGRFQRAILLGDAYPDGSVVRAGLALYAKDGTTGGAVEGWRLIPAGGALAALDTVTAAVLGDQSVTYAKLNNAIFAAQASAEAGTGTGLMTAERVAQAIAARRKRFVSAELDIVSGSTVTLAHGLGAEPAFVQAVLVCKAVEHGYAVGDRILAPMTSILSGNNRVNVLSVGATNIALTFSEYTQPFVAVAKSTGAAVVLTNNSWRVILKAGL